MFAVVADCCSVLVGFWIRVGISYRPLVCGRAHSGHSSCLALGPSKTLQRLYCLTMASDEELSQALSASCFERLTSPFHIHIDRGAFLWFFHFLTQLAREWNLRAAGHVIQDPSMKRLRCMIAWFLDRTSLCMCFFRTSCCLEEHPAFVALSSESTTSCNKYPST